MALNLLARENFRVGELGHATKTGVTRARTGFLPIDGLLVRALEDIEAGKNGNFEELEKKSQ
jgi:hypothetical protein